MRRVKLRRFALKKTSKVDRKRKNTIVETPQKKEKTKGVSAAENREIQPVERQKNKKAKKRSRLLVFAEKFGKVQLEIKSKNAVKALCAIAKICVVSEVKEGVDGVRFCVKSKHLSKIIALLNNLCYDYKIIKIGNFARIALNFPALIGIVLGICASLVLIVAHFSFITRVSVMCVGNDAIKSQVEGILTDMGVVKGANISELDTDCLQKELLSVEGISFASVAKNGTHVEIVVKSALPNESFVEMTGSSVTAYKRAVVTRVVCEGGTAVRKYGDVVDVGDVIIDGYIEYGDAKIDCQARGYAYGKVYYKKSVFFADVAIDKQYGEQISEARLSFFSKEPTPPKCPYDKCEMSLSITDFGFLLPMKIYTYTFREIVTSEVANDMSEEQMAKSAYSALLTELSESAKVLDTYYTFRRLDGGVAVDVTIEAEELIA